MPEGDGQQQDGGRPEPGQGQGEPVLTWEAVVKGMPAEQQALYEAHTQGLRKALEEERGQRKSLGKQLAEAAKAVEEGSAARKALEAAQAQIAEHERRAAFYESAPGDLVNSRLAWLAAVELEAFKRDGSPDWEAIRKAYPELFKAAPGPAGRAGAGTQSPPGKSPGMTEIIRRSAGRQ